MTAPSSPAEVGGVDRCHPSHVTRISMDASSYDEICVNCGATDNIGGWGGLNPLHQQERRKWPT